MKEDALNIDKETGAETAKKADEESKVDMSKDKASKTDAAAET